MRSIGVLVAALVAAVAVSPRTAAYQQTIDDRVQALEALHNINPPGGGDVTLTVGTPETGEYGKDFGSNAHPVLFTAVFDGTAGTSYDLDVTGYDIDFVDEVSVTINGALAGYLNQGPNNGLNAGTTIEFIGIDGENRIEFRERVSGWVWGVTNILVDLTPPDPPPPSGDGLVQGQWLTIPGSSMSTIYDSAIHGTIHNFNSIQHAWGGAACYEPAGEPAELLVTGGGHRDGYLNAVLALNLETGAWRPVTDSSPVWSWNDSNDPNYCPPAPGQPESEQSICTPPAPWSPCPWEGCRVGPDGLPHSRHSYDVMEVEGEYLYIFSGGTWPGAGGAPPEGNAWRLHIPTGSWEPLPYLPFTGQTSNTTALGDGRIGIATPQWRGHIFNPSTGAYDALNVNLTHYINGYTNLTYVPTTDEVYGLGNGRALAWPAGSFPAGSEDFSGSGPTSNTFLASTYYPPEDVIVSWMGGQGIYTLDPISRAWTPMTLGGDDPGPQLGNGTYGRFNYCGGKLVLVNGPNKDLMYVDVPPPTPPSPPEQEPQASTFEGQCADSSTVLCRDLDDDVPDHSWWRHMEGHEGGTIDRDVKSHGTGSLRFDVEPGRQPGDYAVNFSLDGSVSFEPGDAFSVAFKVRYDCAFIYLQGCSGPRRFYLNTNGGPTGPKVSIIGQGDTDVTYDSVGSCTSLEIVLNQGPDHSPAGYHACGWYSGFTKPEGIQFGQLQQNSQPGGDFECFRMPDSKSAKLRGWGFTGPNCYQFPAEQWVHVEQQIYVGPWQRDRTGEPASRYRMVADGEVVIDHMFYNAGPDQKEGATNGYGKAWLIPYMTGKDFDAEHPVGRVWYDELIVRRLET